MPEVMSVELVFDLGFRCKRSQRCVLWTTGTCSWLLMRRSTNRNKLQISRLVPAAKKRTQKSWLDGQMLEVTGIRQRESDDRRFEAETMRAQVAENRRLEEEEQQAERDKKALVKKLSDEMGEMLARRQQRIDDKNKREEETMTAWLDAEKRQKQEEKKRQAVEYAAKCTKAREELEEARKARHERMMQER